MFQLRTINIPYFSRSSSTIFAAVDVSLLGQLDETHHSLQLFCHDPWNFCLFPCRFSDSFPWKLFHRPTLIAITFCWNLSPEYIHLLNMLSSPSDSILVNSLTSFFAQLLLPYVLWTTSFSSPAISMQTPYYINSTTWPTFPCSVNFPLSFPVCSPASPLIYFTNKLFLSF